MGQELIIVGIGASAGGLEALQALVGSLPRQPGMAFLVAMHLDPTQPSSIVELLRRSGPLRVEVATDGDTPEIDTMYVSPPAAQLRLVAGRLRVERNGKTTAHPIDVLFRSLAEELGPRGIAIVLSGSGTDGSVGLAALHAAGGITFAQDESARFDGMPRSAIARDVVDSVLPPAKMAQELLALRDGSAFESPGNPERVPALAEILAVVRARRNLDFSGYRTATLTRRVRRRMGFRSLESSSDYVRLLEAEPAELDALVDDVLINVTEFFRDPEVFEALAARVFAPLDPRAPEQPLRIWVIGCATGQEVYSLAMMMLERQAATGRRFPIRLFATDVDEDALQVARLGWYTIEQCATLSPERRQQFFVPVTNGMQILKSIRDLCVFARHDVTHDPPFSRIDLITCRNVLIYFATELQRRVIPIFHYALNPGGMLLLGKAESVGSFEKLFDTLDADHRIYVRRAGASERILVMSGGSMLTPAEVEADLGPDPAISDVRERQADQFLLTHYAPPAVVLDDELRVLEFRGDTSAFLAHNPGAASFNILKMVRSDLLAQLSVALETAEHDKECLRERVRVRGPKREIIINLRVVRLEGKASGYLVLFETPAHSAARTPTPKLAAVAQSYGRRLLLALESRAHHNDPSLFVPVGEFETMRRRLQQLIEDHGTKTDRLKAANEEVLSTNEELQCTNEELQTTKEEIQATNEELLTLNEELEARNTMLARANDDLNNLVSSTDIPIVMVSHDRRIRRFTPNAARLLNLIEGDIGRPLGHIKPDLEPQVFEHMLEDSLAHLQVETREVQDRKGVWYQVAVRPYRTSDNRIDGAVLAIVEIDRLKRAEQRLRIARDYAESVIATVSAPLLVVDDKLRIASVNRAFATLFEVAEVDVGGRALSELGTDWTEASLREWLARVVGSGLKSSDEAIELRFWAGTPRQRVLTATARPIVRDDDQRLFLIALTDITLRMRDQREIELINSVLEVQAREREYLAHELHDETGQALSAVLVGLSTLAKDIGDQRAAALLGELRERVRELIDNISRMARGLHPAALEQLGFSGAVRQLVDHFTDVHAISVGLKVENEAEFDALPLNIALGLFRVVQEALTNTARHAEASRVDISLARDEGHVLLRVSDDGDGFDVLNQPTAGLGLRLMERRVDQLGGSFRVESTQGMGTQLAIDIPIAVSEESPE